MGFAETGGRLPESTTPGSKVTSSGLRPGSRNHVWSHDFVFTRTSDGRPLRLLTMLDEFTRECLAIDVARRIGSDDVLGRLAQLFAQRGAPAYVTSDNGPEFTARPLRTWLRRAEVQV